MRFPVEKFRQFCAALQLNSKEQGRVRFTWNGAQRRFIEKVAQGLENGIHKFVVCKARQLGLCLHPDTQVLAADLTWRLISNVSPGMELVAVDEFPVARGTAKASTRRMRTAVVRGVRVVHHPAFRLNLSDGRSVICTAEHPWLARDGEHREPHWRAIKKQVLRKVRKLRVGDEIRSVTRPWGEPTPEDGWFSGMLDGEGSMSRPASSGAEINVSQCEGPVWDRLNHWAFHSGMGWRVERDNVPNRPSKFGSRPVHKLVLSRMDDLFGLLGKLRPTRFIERRFWEGKELPGKNSYGAYVRVESIEALPAQPMIDLETSEGTYIAEGLVSHNTTANLALDLFWLYRNNGMQGAMAVPNETVRDLSRNIIDNFIDGLPPSMKWPRLLNNRNEMRFANESRLAHLIAGGRNSGALARGQGLSFVHATEMSSWSDPEGVVSLEASMAETHKSRLYVFESTSRGFNVFHDMWKDAELSMSTEAIFIGWWAKEDYRIPETSRLWNTYGRSHLSNEEKTWGKEVKKLYGVELDRQQWAWWRWKWAESGGSRLLLAEYPFTADQSFVMTGSEFFPLQTLQVMLKGAQKQQGESWNYRLSTRFENTEVYRDDDGPLTVWEEPQPDCSYVIAADPAYGESEWADCFCIEVLKCTATGAVQVAEFNTPDCTMYGFAWIMAHLAGAYSTTRHPPIVILELGGPGRGVLQELQRMPSQYAATVAGLSDRARAELADIFGSIQHYLYRRPDSLSGSSLLQWETTWKTKQIMMNTLRDLLERGMLKVNSEAWINEARYVTQNGTSIKAEGRTQKDDRVIAMALACMAWQEQLMPQLLMRGGVDEYPGMEQNAVARSIGGWLSSLQAQTEEANWQRAGSMSWQD